MTLVETRMIEGRQFVVNWLVKQVYCTKALIRYEIKQLESRLHKAMGDGKNARLKTQEAARYCSELIFCYGNLLELIDQSNVENTAKPSDYTENTTSRCYVKIRRLRQQLSQAMTINDELKTVSELRNYYTLLQSQLNEIDSEPQSLGLIQRSLTGRIKMLLEAKTPADWLSAVVAFANDRGENTIATLAFFTQLDDTELLYLADLFGQHDFVLHINSIFFYKLNPQLLFKQPLHPEKLVSVQARLAMLHHFIEMIHQTVMQSLKQRGVNEVHDYLFHGDELPGGITLDVENDIRDLIITVIKDWRCPILEGSEDLMNKNRLSDLFRAFKFWFNPNRLIDTVLILQRRLVGSEPEGECVKFAQQIQLLYQQLTTTECLELYGYFANKDSCYLMRTLAAAIQGQPIGSLTALNEIEREAVANAYRALDCVMEGIRDELLSRHITTVPYVRHLNAKVIKPGRRNFNALVRIIKLYCNQTLPMNQKIEQLFNEVEGEA